MIRLPLPLQPQGGAVKFVAGLGRADFLHRGDLRAGMALHGFPLRTHPGPALLPMHWLQMGDTAVDPGILEMHKPPLAPERVHQGALMRAVHRRSSLGQHNFILVRAIDVAGAQGHLPAGGDTARRGEDIIPAVPLEKLGAFQGGMPLGIMENNPALAQQPGSIRSHGTDAQLMFEARARMGVGMDQISAAVVVPQGTGINQALSFLNQKRLGPGAGGMVCGGEVDALIWRGEKNPKPAGVKPQGGRPDAAARLDLVIARMRQVPDGMMEQRPIDQVPGMKNRESGRAIETGCGHVKIRPHPDHIRIRIVGVKDGITKGAIPLIRDPRIATRRNGAGRDILNGGRDF